MESGQLKCTNPDAARLVEDYGLQLLSPEERRGLENHVLECDECFQKLYAQGLLTGLLTGGKSLEEQSLAAGEAQLPAHAGGGRDTTTPLSWAGGRRVLVLTGVAAAAVVLSLALWVMMPAHEAERTRGAEHGQILILSPKGEVSPPEVLRWQPVPTAERYEVSIHTQRGKLVWRERTRVAEASIPGHVMASFRTGDRYYWQVSAVLPDGARVETDLVPFTIRE